MSPGLHRHLMNRHTHRQGGKGSSATAGCQWLPSETYAFLAYSTRCEGYRVDDQVHQAPDYEGVGGGKASSCLGPSRIT